ncbi:MAG: bifunctional nuclease domain-containing protein [Chitinispirillaceae bacterium]|jgi:bifunctional DNase/RNase
MLPVDIVNIFLTTKGDEFVILLRSAGDRRTLPISIGQLEAQSIFIKLYHYSFPRPLTHDLFKSVLERFGCKVVKVVISDIVDNTFFARLFIEKDGEVAETDSRPSDAIALAVRFSAPIFVEETIMEKSGIMLPEELVGQTAQTQESTVTQAAEETEPPTLDALKAKLTKAVHEERYEDAAKLRDAIRKLTKSN